MVLIVNSKNIKFYLLFKQMEEFSAVEKLVEAGDGDEVWEISAQLKLTNLITLGLGYT